MPEGTVQGTFTATGASANFIKGGHNKEGVLWLNFGTGTVELQASADGTNWVNESSYTADTCKHVKFPDPNMRYRLNCSAYTADIAYRLSAT